MSESRVAIDAFPAAHSPRRPEEAEQPARARRKGAARRERPAEPAARDGAPGETALGNAARWLARF